MRRKTLLIILPILVLWLAMSLRFYRLDAQSLWNDEGNSARLSERSLPLIIEGTASDIHPPLYYLLLGGWRQLAGDSEFGLRALSAFAGVGIVAATYAVGRATGLRRWQSSLATLLAAVNPALIYYSQEARMYELLALWAVLATLLLLRLLPRLGAGPGGSLWRLGAAYVLVAAAGLYTHYFFPAVLLAHGLIILAWLLTERPSWRSAVFRLLCWALLAGAAALLYLPWIPVFLRQAGGRPGDDVRVLPFLADAWRWLLFGPPGQEAALPALLAPGALALLAVGIGLRVAARADRRLPPAIVAALMVLVPVMFMVAAGTMRPAYFKFMSVSVPFIALLLAAGVAVAWRAITAGGAGRVGARLLALGLVALFLQGSASSVRDIYFDPAYARADYRGIAERIEQTGHTNAGIVLNAANQWEVFTYYHRQGAPVYPIPRGRPQPDQVAGELSEIAARHDRLYALYWGDAERDPQRLVESWLDAHTFKATEEWVGDVRFVTYAVPPEPSAEMEQRAGVTFGESIVLDGYTLAQGELAPGDIAQITLFWQATDPVDVRYKVFLHLVDGEARPLAQRDAEPGGGGMPTTEWEPQHTVVDNHGVFVPLQTPPGRYDLFVGLYPLDDPAARLSLMPDNASGRGDAYHLGTLSVVAPDVTASPGAEDG